MKNDTRLYRGSGVVASTKSLYDTILHPDTEPGEKHAILYLPDGTFTRGSYIGPGSDIIGRIKRNSQPKTMTDTVAQAHDIRYTLAKTPEDVREADNKMINKMKSIQNKKEDYLFNILQGKLGIQAKVLLEDLGIWKKGKFAELDKPKTYTRQDLQILHDKLLELEQQGFGKKK